jgi:membrane associated rhomboid family serine protease
MSSYFLLQFKIHNRHFSDFDLHPVLGYLFVTLLFVLGSSGIFLFGNYSPYADTFIGVGVATALGGEIKQLFLQ